MNLFELLLLPLLAVVLLSVPFIGVWQKKKFATNSVATANAKVRNALLWNVCSFLAILILATVLPVADIITFAADETVAEAFTVGKGLAYIGAGCATGIGSIGCGIAVAGAAPAAIGASAEDPKNFSKSLIFVVLGEGVAIYGFVISFLIINSL
jgi:V/A-type H+-transporting ATPase subunit K